MVREIDRGGLGKGRKITLSSSVLIVTLLIGRARRKMSC